MKNMNDFIKKITASIILHKLFKLKLYILKITFYIHKNYISKYYH